MTVPLLTKRAVTPSCTGFNDRFDFEDLTKICRSVADADFVEVYAERRVTTKITLAEHKINSARYGIKEGVGVRVIRGTQTGYAYCEDLNLKNIRHAAQTASYISREKSGGSFPRSVNISPRQTVIPVAFYPIENDASRKTNLLQRANAAARDENSCISEVSCAYYDEEQEIRIANSDGIRCSDQRSLYGFHVLALAEENDYQNTGYAVGGGRISFAGFEKRTPEVMGREAAMQAVRKLNSRDCPAGRFEVVINKGWGGVLIHEAVGHGLESDFNRRGSSVYAGKIGQKVAPEWITIIDDGTLEQGRGSMNIDDEGTPCQKNILIENGILKNYLYDTYNARLMNTAPTGNGRREDFTQIPLPRMTNTYIAGGETDPADMIRSIKRGLFARTLGGGQVDSTSGNFVFEVQEGYWIEDGEITYPVRGANLVGNGPEIINHIVAVGNDLTIETGIGTCSKDGQNIPVGIGQPTIKISSMTVGGTKL